MGIIKRPALTEKSQAMQEKGQYTFVVELTANKIEIAKEVKKMYGVDARNEILDIHMADSLEDYLLQIILATRNPSAYGDDLAAWLQYGASPRASIALDRCSRAKAWLAQRYEGGTGRPR